MFVLECFIGFSMRDVLGVIECPMRDLSGSFGVSLMVSV